MIFEELKELLLSCRLVFSLTWIITGLYLCINPVIIFLGHVDHSFNAVPFSKLKIQSLVSLLHKYQESFRRLQSKRTLSFIWNVRRLFVRIYSSNIGCWLETRCDSVTCSNCRRPAPNMTSLWNASLRAEPPGRQSCCFEAIAGSLRPTTAAARGVSDVPQPPH